MDAGLHLPQIEFAGEELSPRRLAERSEPMTLATTVSLAALRGRVCVGPAGMCAELLSGFAEAGCGRVHFWPLGAEPRQIDLIASTVPPGVRR